MHIAIEGGHGGPPLRQGAPSLELGSVSSGDISAVDVLGFSVSTMGPEAIDAWLRGVLTGDAGGCWHVVTLNPEYVMAAGRDAAFAAAIRAAELRTADGVGIVAAARAIRGARVPRVTGVELLERLAALAAERGAGLYLLGGGPGVAARAGAALAPRHQGLRIAGTSAEGTSHPADDAAALAKIAASGAAIVAVAYGAPGQVLWIERNRAALAAAGIRIAIGVGGTLDYLAGSARRPPDPIRRLGIEWLYRLLREPWRWRRQLVLPVFAARVLLAAARVRLPFPRQTVG